MFWLLLLLALTSVSAQNVKDAQQGRSRAGNGHQANTGTAKFVFQTFRFSPFPAAVLEPTTTTVDVDNSASTNSSPNLLAVRADGSQTSNPGTSSSTTSNPPAKDHTKSPQSSSSAPNQKVSVIGSLIQNAISQNLESKPSTQSQTAPTAGQDSTKSTSQTAQQTQSTDSANNPPNLQKVQTQNTGSNQNPQKNNGLNGNPNNSAGQNSAQNEAQQNRSSNTSLSETLLKPVGPPSSITPPVTPQTQANPAGQTRVTASNQSNQSNPSSQSQNKDQSSSSKQQNKSRTQNSSVSDSTSNASNSPNSSNSSPSSNSSSNASNTSNVQNSSNSLSNASNGSTASNSLNSSSNVSNSSNNTSNASNASNAPNASNSSSSSSNYSQVPVIIDDINVCRVVLPPLNPNPVANLSIKAQNLVVPSGATIFERPRSASILGNLKSTRYEKFYWNERSERVSIENVTVTTRLNDSIPESWELPAVSTKIVPFNRTAPIEDPKTFKRWESFSEALFEELNYIRTKPKQYAQFVKDQMKTFIGDLEYEDSGKRYIAMEGKHVWQETIEFLNVQRPMAALRRVQCLDCSANYMMNDMGKHQPDEYDPNYNAHRDSRGELTSNRTSTACLIGTGGENIAAGAYSARSFILQLVIDDNVPSRGHRINIFTNYTQVGISTGYNEQFGTITVHDFLF